jgi:hypothetical protein
VTSELSYTTTKENFPATDELKISTINGNHRRVASTNFSAYISSCWERREKKCRKLVTLKRKCAQRRIYIVGGDFSRRGIQCRE